MTCYHSSKGFEVKKVFEDYPRDLTGFCSIELVQNCSVVIPQDQLAPFECGSDPAEKVILNTDSPDFWCQNSLLKLQSLLMSPLCRSGRSGRNPQLWPSCREIVVGYLAVKDETIGSLSLRLIADLDNPVSRYLRTSCR